MPTLQQVESDPGLPRQAKAVHSMRVVVNVAPPNSVVLVLDPTASPAIPSSMRGGTVAATSSCIVVGTLTAADGPTEIALSDEEVATEDDLARVFEGTLHTPGRVVAVESVDGETLLRLDVPHTSTRVVVRTDHASEPTRIEILVTR